MILRGWVLILKWIKAPLNLFLWLAWYTGLVKARRRLLADYMVKSTVTLGNWNGKGKAKTGANG